MGILLNWVMRNLISMLEGTPVYPVYAVYGLRLEYRLQSTVFLARAYHTTDVFMYQWHDHPFTGGRLQHPTFLCMTEWQLVLNYYNFIQFPIMRRGYLGFFAPAADIRSLPHP